ncbi:MAG TPA: lactonase family protein [Opitutaceae bacterium]|nr:lactonase family protein [Opitutaceae bacterium]
MPFSRFTRSVGAALLALSAFSIGRAASELFYIGTYTGSAAEGIYSARLDTNTGQMSDLKIAVKTANPAWLAISPDGKFVYAGNEVNEYGGKKTGFVTATQVVGDGTTLRVLNQQSSEGRGPCHVSVDTAGDCLFVANYAGGSIAALPIRNDGTLVAATSKIQHTGKGKNPKRQDAAHAHQIQTSPDGKYVYAVDLGLDRIKAYAYDAENRTLTAAPERDVIGQPGRGPRHFVFNPAGDRIYLLNELGSDLSVFTFDGASGASKEIQNISVLPKDFKGENTAAEIQIDRAGKHVYASNRGDDSIVVLNIVADGKLEFAQRVSTGGRVPRNFVLDPSGQFLIAANQQSNDIYAFRIDPEKGTLTRVEGSSLQLSKPVAIAFAKAK